MTARKRLGLAIVLVTSVVVAGTMARTQGQIQPPVQPLTPTVISGADLGFRVDGRKGSTPIGTLVVRVNGQWIEAEFGPGVKRLTAR
jgi:hypothetical protein